MSKCQKLQQRRLRPFTVTKRINSTTYQIQDDQDPTIVKAVHLEKVYLVKTVQNQLVEYFPKEESLPAMIEEYNPSDKRHDDICERFMERRIQKLNHHHPVVRSDSIPFPITPLSPATTAISTKRISNTSVDSGVNSPPPVSPSQTSANVDFSQRTPPPILSNFRPMTASHSSARPLTPIQQIIHNGRPSRNRDPGRKEPSYIRSQPDHPDTQSVLRTQTRQD